MKNTKLFIILLIVIILLILGIKTKDEEGEKISSETEVFSGDETQILLYFSDNDKTKLMPEYRYVSMESIKDNMVKTIVEELIKGPTAADLLGTIPDTTKINSIEIDKNKVVVDFSNDYNLNSGDEDLKLHKIYSIVNSLTEIKEIEEVEIRVEGEFITTEKRI